ncbi:MAG: hypothetical protein HY689_04960 [Chloroflexi bacterium]|nr:hypothetical protein [Chloroflexota bacterium]
MPEYRFERECRTAYSEAYTILDDEETIGHIDLHFTTSAVYGTLSVTEAVAGEEIHQLIGTIDEDLVMSADPYRTNFIVHVYQGREVGVFSDVDSEEEEDEEEQGQGPWNGHGP